MIREPSRRRRATGLGLLTIALAGCGGQATSSTSNAAEDPVTVDDTLGSDANGTTHAASPTAGESVTAGSNAADTGDAPASAAGNEAAAADQSTGASTTASGATDANDSGADAESSDANAAGESGAAQTDSSATDAALSTDLPAAEPLDAGPGVYLVSSETDVGAGACEDVSVADVVQIIHDDNDELSDIARFAPDPFLHSVGVDVEPVGPDEDYFRAVITGEGQIVVGLRRCDGEVVDLQCTDESWWYFETDGDCQPQLAGEYRHVLEDDCFETEGTPSTYFDAPVLERDTCGFDAQSQDLRGSFDLAVFAEGQLCPGGDDFDTATLLETRLTLEIDQDPNSLQDATVTLHSEQFPCLDGSSFPAEVIGGQIIAEHRYFADGDSTQCHPTQQLTLSLFGAAEFPPFAGILDFAEISNDPCTSPVPEYAFRSGFHFVLESS